MAPEKVSIFVKAFIEQNTEFFRQDPTINDWLQLLETGVVFHTNTGNSIPENDESTTIMATGELKSTDANMDKKDAEEVKGGDVEMKDVLKKNESIMEKT